MPTVVQLFGNNYSYSTDASFSKRSSDHLAEAIKSPNSVGKCQT